MNTRSLLPFLLTASILTPVAAQNPAPGRAATDWGEVQFFKDQGLTRGVIAGPIDSVWKVLTPTFKAMGLKVSVQDKSTGQIGNPKFRAVRQLGKTAISRYFSCGEGLTGPNADSWYVYIGFGIAVVPAGPAQTRFEMQMQARAIDVPDGRNEQVSCTTTGMLEYALVNRLKEIFPGTK